MATIDAAGSGNRPRPAAEEQARTDLRRAMRAGEPVDEIFESFIGPLVEKAVPTAPGRGRYQAGIRGRHRRSGRLPAGRLPDFWGAVADWQVSTGVPMESSATLHGIQNEQLRMLLWTANRTLSTGDKLGIADAVRYEKAGGAPVPGYSHITVALRSTGQG